VSTNQLQTIEYACHRLNEKPQRVYNLIREHTFPAGVVVRLGRRIRINPEKLEEFIASGGQALPGGWRKENSAGAAP
jgi:excisionase family DNA binding protein